MELAHHRSEARRAVRWNRRCVHATRRENHRLHRGAEYGRRQDAMVVQDTPGDAWVVGCIRGNDHENCPKNAGPDYDFGSSPMLMILASGKSVLIAGQKSGNVWAHDPDRKGAVVWKTAVFTKLAEAQGQIVWGGTADDASAYFGLEQRGHCGAGAEQWRAAMVLAASSPPRAAKAGRTRRFLPSRESLFPAAGTAFCALSPLKTARLCGASIWSGFRYRERRRGQRRLDGLGRSDHCGRHDLCRLRISGRTERHDWKRAAGVRPGVADYIPAIRCYLGGMVKTNSDPMISTEEEVEVDAETATAIERGIQAAQEGRVVSSEEVRKLVPQWISKFSTQNQR